MTKDIKQIWEDVCQGDRLAWQRLVKLYSGLVYTVARRAGLAAPDAEDCAQQTWLTLYQKRRSIKDPVALPAWLIRTTHRQAVAITQKRSVSFATDLNESHPDQAELPDVEIIKLERQALLATAVKKLDDRCRLLLSSLFLTDKKISYRSLARTLGVNLNSFGALRSRCLLKLKKIIGNIGYEWH
jgi:RNA polymerase sigma factor (sigma-70 family)